MILRTPTKMFGRVIFVAFVAALLAGCGRTANKPDPGPPIDRAIWRKLTLGMSPEQVKAVLGEPKSTDSQDDVVCWYYLAGQPLERHAVEAKKWMFPRGAVLFSTASGGGPRLVDWRDP